MLSVMPVKRRYFFQYSQHYFSYYIPKLANYASSKFFFNIFISIRFFRELNGILFIREAATPKFPERKNHRNSPRNNSYMSSLKKCSDFFIQIK